MKEMNIINDHVLAVALDALVYTLLSSGSHKTLPGKV